MAAEVSTVGTGEVERTADRATVRVTYVARSGKRTNATNALAGRIADVEPLLDVDGVEVRDRRLVVQSTWDGKRRSGAEARQLYTLRITDLAVLDDLLGSLIGTEPETVLGPEWELADQEEAAREARRRAVAGARARAEDYAVALGMRLGPLARITDDSPGHEMPRRFAAARTESAQPDVCGLNLEPQPVRITASCTITWELRG